MPNFHAFLTEKKNSTSNISKQRQNSSLKLDTMTANIKSWNNNEISCEKFVLLHYSLTWSLQIILEIPQ